MTKTFVEETFTAKQLREYAEAWGCTVQEAQWKLEKLVIDQTC